MRWWFLAVKASMEMDISWQKGWAVGDDIIGCNSQARDLLSGQR